MRRFSKLAPWLISLAGGICCAGANAAVVYLDQFVVTKNGSTFFSDNFSDGSPPPSAPGDPTGYGVFGTFAPGSKASGILRLDSADGGLSQNALDQDRLTLRATVIRSTDSSNLTTGLKIDDTPRLQGVFSLSSLTGPLINGYGIRRSDRNAAGVNRHAELDVRFNPAAGKVAVRYSLQDFVANQITEVRVADYAPPAAADQIELLRARPDTTNNNFYASYNYLDAGNIIGGGTFATPIGLFQSESYVRAEFHAFEALAVPEPGTLALLSLGLVGLGLARRRRAWSHNGRGKSRCGGASCSGCRASGTRHRSRGDSRPAIGRIAEGLGGDHRLLLRRVELREFQRVPVGERAQGQNARTQPRHHAGEAPGRSCELTVDSICTAR